MSDGSDSEASKERSADRAHKFEEQLIHTAASIRVTGSKQEINLVVNGLAAKGFFYRTNKTLYPCQDDPKKFYLYLNFIKVPALLEVKDD